MIPEADALQHVLEEPWRDAPRRTFASSVESLDPARSQYVRLALTLAQALRSRERYSEWSAIEAEMTRAAPFGRRAEWCAPLRSVVGEKASVVFGRGFPEGITVDAAQFLARAPAIYAVAPILDLRVANVAAVAEAFFQSPFLARIRSLEFADYSITIDLVETLVRSPFLGRLLSLNLYFQPCGRAGFEQLAAAETLPELQWVGGGGRDTPDVNPIPREDESGVYGHDENPYAVELTRRFGARPWLCRLWNSHEPPRPEALSAP